MTHASSYRVVRLLVDLGLHSSWASTVLLSLNIYIYISLHFVNLFCLCLAVSVTRRALFHSLLIRSLSSLFCNGFSALVEVLGVSMFATTSKTTLN